MDLNSIKLSPGLIEDLYGDSLIYPLFKENKIAEKITPDTGENNTNDVRWASLGNNQKNILIVVKHPGIPFIADAELEFLVTILKACKLDLADVAIINIAGQEQSGYVENSSVIQMRMARDQIIKRSGS